jgi:soluble P-type ATPase
MKIVYYITDHGLGHATRTVAIIRELKKKSIDVVVRSNDKLGFLKKSLPDVQIIHGSTDFTPVMQKNNPMRFSDIQTKKKLLDWIVL